MRKNTITGQIYSVTAANDCTILGVKNNVYYELLSLKAGEQGTFQAISDAVEVTDDNSILLPFDAARSAVLGTGKGNGNGNASGSSSSWDEERISAIEKDLLEIHSAIENDFQLSDEQQEAISLISTDEFRSFAEWAQWDCAQTDLLKICNGGFTAHINNTSLHGGGGSADFSDIAISARTFDGQRLSAPLPQRPDGSSWTEIPCVIDLSLLVEQLENNGHNFCDENGGSSSGGSSETYNRFVVTMERLPEISAPGMMLGDVSSLYDHLTVNGKNFVGKIHGGESYLNSYGWPMTFDGDGEVTLKEFSNAFHEKISSIWTDEQHDFVHIFPSIRYQW